MESQSVLQPATALQKVALGDSIHFSISFKDRPFGEVEGFFSRFGFVVKLGSFRDEIIKVRNYLVIIERN